MIVVDTSGLLAALFPDQRRHEPAAAVLRGSEGPFLLSPFVLAELDYLISKLAGTAVELKFLDEVAGGAYHLVEFGPAEVALARNVIARYDDLGIGLADASVVVIALARKAHRILTLDERHFRVLTGPAGRPFELLPLDA